MRRYAQPKGDELPQLILIAALFVCGCALGRYVSSHLTQSGLAAAGAVVDGIRSGNYQLSFFERLFNSAVAVGKLPVLAALLSVSGYGRYMLAPVFGAKGFLLTFYSGCFTALLSSEGLKLALATVIPASLFTLPFMVLVSMWAFSDKRGAGNRGFFPPGYLLLLAAAIIADMYISPMLIGWLGL